MYIGTKGADRNVWSAAGGSDRRVVPRRLLALSLPKGGLARIPMYIGMTLLFVINNPP
ncbi:unnamed protein product, partial [marine sediment metagenome]